MTNVSYPASYPAIILNVPANGLLELEGAADGTLYYLSSLIVLSLSGPPPGSRCHAGWSDSTQNHGYYREMGYSTRRDFRVFYPQRKLKSLRWSTTTPTFLIVPVQQRYIVH